MRAWVFCGIRTMQNHYIGETGMCDECLARLKELLGMAQPAASTEAPTAVPPGAITFTLTGPAQRRAGAAQVICVSPSSTRGSLVPAMRASAVRVASMPRR